MITISLCMIVKNEENTLERCLNSVKEAVDEIIIVDTGSTDSTKEKALAFTDKVFDFKWIDDFSAARNFSYKKASMDYIMWLDADDIFLEEDLKKLKALKETLPNNTDVVMMKYNIAFNEKGETTFSYFRERLSKRTRNFKWLEPVHEHLQIGGSILNSDIAITHQKPSGRSSHRNIAIYENIIKSGKELSPRGMYYYARELKEKKRWKDAIKWFEKFLGSKKGWVKDNVTACRDLSRCYKAIGESEKSFTTLTRSFIYGIPRAEVCCEMGYYFEHIAHYKEAIYWFVKALESKKSKDSWGFHEEDSFGYIPCVECAVCFDKLGDYEKAQVFNDAAALFKPNSFAVLHNKKYLAERIRRKENVDAKIP